MKYAARQTAAEQRWSEQSKAELSSFPTVWLRVRISKNLFSSQKNVNKRGALTVKWKIIIDQLAQRCKK